MKITTPTSRVRTSFDPELELPKLHQWFAENPHPSRLTLQMYVKELNSLASRQSRKLLEVHNLCYWFKNARAAYKRAELRMKKNHDHLDNANGQQQANQLAHEHMSDASSKSRNTSAASMPPSLGNQGPKPLSNHAFSMQTASRSLQSSPKASSPPKTSLNSSGPHQSSKKLYQQHEGSLGTLNDVKGSLTSDQNDGSGQGAKLGGVGAKFTSHIVKSNSNFNGDECVMNNTNLSKIFENSHSLGLNVDASVDSSDIAINSPTARADSTSPSSTVSMATTGNGITGSHNTLNNIDLASAVNCLLATNFTAAAAAAAAAAASTTLTSGSLPAANLLQGHSSAAINLAATFINNNLLSGGNGNALLDPTSLAAATAAVLNGRKTVSAAPNDPTAAAVAAAAAQLVEPPMRQLFTAFTPSNYQFPLGLLDNKVLDSNILNAMSFPTSACGSDTSFSRHAPGLPQSARHNRQPRMLHHQRQAPHNMTHHAISLIQSGHFKHHHNHRTRLNGSRNNGL